MGFYVNKFEHLDGDLVLYQRNLDVASPNAANHRKPKWYMKLKIGGGKKPIDRSTKLTVYEEAYAFARKEYDRLRNAVSLGHTLKDFTFEQHWNEWYQRQLNNRVWRESRARWHKMYAERYFKAYFRNADGTSMLLNQITPTFAHGYWDWRIAYWSSHQGEKLKTYNPKRQKAKTSTTHNAKPAPSKKTLEMEQTALNQIFFDARERGRLQQVFKLKSPRSNQPHVRRPHFEIKDEYKRLTSALRSYRGCTGPFAKDHVNVWHRLQRQQLYHFVMFSLNSGLRVGECREMRWKDIRFDQGDGAEGEKIAVVTVRKATKKGQNRDVQTQPTANKTLKEWREKSPSNGENDLVWFGQKKDDDGKAMPFSNLNKSFQNFLVRVAVPEQEHGMLYNKEGEKRSLYSLRHTYATMRREIGNVDYDDLALNMGCSRVQLEKHYGQSDSHSRRADITKVIRTGAKSEKSAKPEVAAEGMDALLMTAMQQYKSGKIDQATFMAVMDMGKVKA